MTLLLLLGASTPEKTASTKARDYATTTATTTHKPAE